MFVRQNTPHPKELKAKAQRLFNKGISSQNPEEDDDNDNVPEENNQNNSCENVRILSFLSVNFLSLKLTIMII